MERRIPWLRIPGIKSERKTPDTNLSGMERIHSEILEGLGSLEKEGLSNMTDKQIAKRIKDLHPGHRFWDHPGPDTITNAMYDLEDKGLIETTTVRELRKNGRIRKHYFYSTTKSQTPTQD